MSLKVSTIPDSGLLMHKFVMRQNPPAPVYFITPANIQTTTLFGLPAKHVVCGVRVQLVTAFVAFALSSCTVTIGANNGVMGNLNYYAPAFECKQTASPTAFMYWSPLASYTTAPHDVTATFTATGAQISDLTAGEVEVTIMYRPF